MKFINHSNRVHSYKGTAFCHVVNKNFFFLICDDNYQARGEQARWAFPVPTSHEHYHRERNSTVIHHNSYKTRTTKLESLSVGLAGWFTSWQVGINWSVTLPWQNNRASDTIAFTLCGSAVFPWQENQNQCCRLHAKFENKTCCAAPRGEEMTWSLWMAKRVFPRGFINFSYKFFGTKWVSFIFLNKR